MLVKPPILTQPPKIDETPKENKNISLISNGIIENNGHEVTRMERPLLNQNDTSKDIFIRKKRQYRMFIKLVREGKYTSARLVSKALGVDNNTVLSWLNTKRVQACMDKEISNYVSRIAGSKDWKAQAYLLDKAIGQDKEEKIIDIQNIVLIKH
jgi:hypothetical protein